MKDVLQALLKGEQRQDLTHFQSAAMTYSATDVVLINPPASAIKEERYDLPKFPAIGIGYVAGYAERVGGIRPMVIDARMERMDSAAVVEWVVRLAPKIVGFSAMTHMVITTARLARQIRARLPTVKLVLGGFHASFLPARTLDEFPVFDYLVVGEGEMSFLDLCRALDNGEGQPTIPGIWYRRSDGTIHDGGRSLVPPTLDELGSPAWHLFDQAAFRSNIDTIPIMSQRGCPFSCNFCSRPYGQQVRQRTPSLVVDEIEDAIKTYGIRNFKFYDETFTVNKQHTADICREIIDRKLPITWWAHAHANTIDLNLANLMREANCQELGMGVESGNDIILASMKKGVTRDRILKVGRVLRQAKLAVSFNFIIGHPNETLSSILDTVLFAAQLNPQEPVFGIMVPYPGTEVWEMARKGEGGYVKLSENWDDYNKQLGNAVQLRTVSRRWMEFMQSFGYVFVFVYNFRLRDLIKIIKKNQVLVFKILRKLAMGR